MKMQPMCWRPLLTCAGFGARTISAIGGSLGGDAVGNAEAQSQGGVFDRMVFLGSEGGDHPEKLRGRKLFIVARDDASGSGPRLPSITRHYEQTSEPNQVVVLDRLSPPQLSSRQAKART